MSGTVGRDACSVIYLDADKAITDCMSDKGYAIRRGARDCRSYFEASCYAPKWLWDIQGLLGARNSN